MRTSAALLLVCSLVATVFDIKAQAQLPPEVERAAQTALYELQSNPSEGVRSLITEIENLDKIGEQNRKVLAEMNEAAVAARAKIPTLLGSELSIIEKIREFLPVCTYGLNDQEVYLMAQSMVSGVKPIQPEFRVTEGPRNLRDVWRMGGNFLNMGRTNEVFFLHSEDLKTNFEVLQERLIEGFGYPDTGRKFIPPLFSEFYKTGNVGTLIKELNSLLANQVRMEAKGYFASAMAQVLSVAEVASAFDDPMPTSPDYPKKIDYLLARKINFSARRNPHWGAWLQAKYLVDHHESNENVVALKAAEEALARATADNRKAEAAIAELRLKAQAKLAATIVKDSQRIEALKGVLKSNASTQAVTAELQKTEAEITDLGEAQKLLSSAQKEVEQARLREVATTELSEASVRTALIWDSSDNFDDIFDQFKGFTEQEIRSIIRQTFVMVRADVEKTARSGLFSKDIATQTISVPRYQLEHIAGRVAERVKKARHGRPPLGIVFENDRRRFNTLTDTSAGEQALRDSFAACGSPMEALGVQRK